MKPTKTRRGPGLSLSKPFWNAHPQAPHMKNRVSVIYGLSSGPAVDVSIADLVLRMNEVGLVTNFCCSGAQQRSSGSAGSSCWVHLICAPGPKGSRFTARRLSRKSHSYPRIPLQREARNGIMGACGRSTRNLGQQQVPMITLEEFSTKVWLRGDPTVTYLQTWPGAALPKAVATHPQPDQ